MNGVTGGLNSFAIVEEAYDVRLYNRKKIAVLSQTTMLREKTDELAEKVRELNPASEVASTASSRTSSLPPEEPACRFR